MSRRDLFDEAGIPYDFEASLPSSSSSTRSETDSLSDKSPSVLENKSKSVTFPIPRTRGSRLDSRLFVPQREHGGIWKGQDTPTISSRGSSRDASHSGVTPTLHTYMLVERGNESPRTNIYNYNPPTIKVKIRGRVDGRIYIPRLQTRFMTSLCRIQGFAKQCLMNGCTTSSSDKIVTPNQISRPPRFSSFPSSENVLHRKSPFQTSQNFQNSSNYIDNVFHLRNSSLSSTLGADHRERSGETLCAQEERECQRKHCSLLPSPSNQQYRGRIDGRLHTPQDMDCQIQLTSYGSGDSMQNLYQDVTYNDGLGLEERLLPETTNLYQNKRETLFEFLQLRGRVDGRLFALHKKAKWGVNNASSQIREDDMTSKMFEPSFIQKLYKKRLGHNETAEDEKLTDRPLTTEFPSSFDGEFVRGTNKKSLDSFSAQDSASLPTSSTKHVGGEKTIPTADSKEANVGQGSPSLLTTSRERNQGNKTTPNDSKIASIKKAESLALQTPSSSSGPTYDMVKLWKI